MEGKAAAMQNWSLGGGSLLAWPVITDSGLNQTGRGYYISSFCQPEYSVQQQEEEEAGAGAGGGKGFAVVCCDSIPLARCPVPESDGSPGAWDRIRDAAGVLTKPLLRILAA